MVKAEEEDKNADPDPFSAPFRDLKRYKLRPPPPDATPALIARRTRLVKASGKLIVLFKLLGNMAGEKRKVLIFSQVG